MDQEVIAYYEGVFKNEMMIMQHQGTNITLKELAAEFVYQNKAQSEEILAAYLNVRKEVIGY